MKKKILYAESGYSSHEMVRVYLEGEDYSLINTSLINTNNSLKAIELYKSSNNIDLILLEVDAPKVDVFLDLIKKIRELNEGVPIIAITDYFVEGSKNEMKKSGCNLFLKKPVSKPQLLEAIIEQLKS